MYSRIPSSESCSGNHHQIVESLMEKNCWTCVLFFFWVWRIRQDIPAKVNLYPRMKIVETFVKLDFLTKKEKKSSQMHQNCCDRSCLEDAIPMGRKNQRNIRTRETEHVEIIYWICTFFGVTVSRNRKPSLRLSVYEEKEETREKWEDYIDVVHQLFPAVTFFPLSVTVKRQNSLFYAFFPSLVHPHLDPKIELHNKCETTDSHICQTYFLLPTQNLLFLSFCLSVVSETGTSLLSELQQML